MSDTEELKRGDLTWQEEGDGTFTPIIVWNGARLKGTVSRPFKALFFNEREDMLMRYMDVISKDVFGEEMFDYTSLKNGFESRGPKRQEFCELPCLLYDEEREAGYEHFMSDGSPLPL